MSASVIAYFENAAYRASQTHPNRPLCYGVNPSHTEKVVNQNAWRIFRRALIDTLGDKFGWICQRYGIDVDRKIQEGRPLLAKHVELFSIGAAQVLCCDVKRLCRLGTKVRDLSREVLCRKFKKAQVFHNILGKQLNPQQIFATPSDRKAWYTFDVALMDREKQICFEDVASLSFPAYQERLTKVLANKELVEKQLLPAPGSNGDIDFYCVHQKICTGDGLVAYALKPAASDSDLEPLLIFRCSQMAVSQEDIVPSLLEDLAPKVAETGYAAAKSQFEELFSDFSFLPADRRLKIAAYSIGAAQAQRVVADFSDRISEATFYSAPSIDTETVVRFAQEIDAADRANDPLNIFIYRTENDFCTYAGEKHLGWGIDSPNATVTCVEYTEPRGRLSTMQLHALRHFDTNRSDLTSTNVDSPEDLLEVLDNTKRGPEAIWYEKMRTSFGRFAYFYLLFVHTILKGCEHIFGITLLRTSRR